MTDRGTMTLLPPASHLCQECAGDHDPSQPHNARSLYYGTRRVMLNQPPATWLTAMEHCSPAVREAWRGALMERGIDVDGGGL